MQWRLLQPGAILLGDASEGIASSQTALQISSREVMQCPGLGDRLAQRCPSETRGRCRRRTPSLKVVAAEPERASIRSLVEICLAPPEMTEQHACPGAPSHFGVQVRCHQQRLEQIMAD